MSAKQFIVKVGKKDAKLDNKPVRSLTVKRINGTNEVKVRLSDDSQLNGTAVMLEKDGAKIPVEPYGLREVKLSFTPLREGLQTDFSAKLDERTITGAYPLPVIPQSVEEAVDNIFLDDKLADILMFLTVQRAVASLEKKYEGEKSGHFHSLLMGQSRSGKSFFCEMLPQIVNYVTSPQGIYHVGEKESVVYQTIVSDLSVESAAVSGSILYEAKALRRLHFAHQVSGLNPIAVVDEFNRSRYVANEILGVLDAAETDNRVPENAGLPPYSIAELPFSVLLTGNMLSGYGGIDYSQINTAVLMRLHGIFNFQVTPDDAIKIVRLKKSGNGNTSSNRLKQFKELLDKLREGAKDYESHAETAEKKAEQIGDALESAGKTLFQTAGIGVDDKIVLRELPATGLYEIAFDSILRTMKGALMAGKEFSDSLLNRIVKYHLIHSVLNQCAKEKPLNANSAELSTSVQASNYRDIFQ